MQTRRSLLKNGGLIALGAAVINPRTLFAISAKPLFPDGYPDRKEIINAAIESAMAAGASYADARLSHIEIYGIQKYTPDRTEKMAFGVRALYQGYWGFAASPVWSKEEGARLGAAAVAQAKANVLGRERVTELAPIGEATGGHWETPIKDDPFKIHPDELLDFYEGLKSYVAGLKYMSTSQMALGFQRVNKAFGSSHNQFVTQMLFSSYGLISFSLQDRAKRVTSGGVVEELSPAGYGFEYFRDRPLREYIRVTHEEAVADLSLPLKPIDVGKYNILIDQSGVASLLSQSVGRATEIDRVFGYEANAGGTSYITDPSAALGTLKIGSPLFNVTCDRSQEGSVGRVKWDDEGVTPARYDLVKNGILTNLQTNREGASWIQDYYQRTGQPVRSVGAANSPSALDVPLVHQSDLYLQPDTTAASRDDLREGLGDGIEFRVPTVSMDFQQSTGFLRGRSYEIKKGKRVARFMDAGILFRSMDLWNNMTKVGGTESVKYYGVYSTKGQPEQKTASGVYAPPATFKDLTVIDVRRKG
jgi:TldD protein